MPPVALTEEQVVFLYFFRISIVRFNRVTSEILVKRRKFWDNYEVNTYSQETEALFVIRSIGARNGEKLCNPG